MPPVVSVIVAALLLVWAPVAVGSEQGISYGPDPSQKLDICTPPGAPARSPAVLLIHGGGWVAGERASNTGLCRRFAQAGVVTIPIDYRLYVRTAGSTWPAQFNDAQLAMRWVRSHAAEYGIDPGHICAEGGSSGAQLALLLGVVPRIDPGDMQNVLSGVSPRADCVISISGITDMVALAGIHRNVLTVLLGPERMNLSHIEALERNASPALRVRAGAAPTLFIHGLDDPLAPYAHVVEMQDALAKVGTPCWVVTYPGEHALKGLDKGQVRQAFDLVLAFAQAGRLAGPPRTLPFNEAVAQLP